MKLSTNSLWIAFGLLVSATFAGEPVLNFPAPLSATLLDRLHSPIIYPQATQGAASCAASACHGGPRPGIAEEFATRGAEYPLWLENDPHAQSWRTLCSDASVRMMEKLKIMRAGRVVDADGFNNCLACHSSQGQLVSTSSHASYGAPQPDNYGEGIGCSSCHGPSEGWRDDHYRLQRDDESAASVGLVPNKNLLVRARTCAACHVGDRDRDMNHDIIAAGHPALHYEFATYHARLPKHWRDPQAADPNFEAQLWLAGQIAALDASLVLMESRANEQLAVSTWPEFSVSNCADCHQSLRLPKLEGKHHQRGKTAGWGDWNRYGFQLWLNQPQGPAGSLVGLQTQLAQLESVLRSEPTPDAQQVAHMANQLRLALDHQVSSNATATLRNFSAGQLKAVVSSQQPAELRSWESAAQFYLASIASRQVWYDRSVQPLAREVRQALMFDPDSNSLALQGQPADRREIYRRLEALQQALQLRSAVPDVLRPRGEELHLSDPSAFSIPYGKVDSATGAILVPAPPAISGN